MRDAGSGMRAALEQARLAASKDEVPIGAVVMRGDEIIAEAHNETVARGNPTCHAEFLAIERAPNAPARSCWPRSGSWCLGRMMRRRGCAGRWGIWCGIRG